MRLLIDMNLSPDWVAFLTQNGFEAVHWSTAGSPWATDPEIMEYAAKNKLVVFTHDLDFGMLLAIGGASAPSVIQLPTQDVLPDAIGQAFLRSLEAVREYLEAGALVTVEPGRHRIRVLPI